MEGKLLESIASEQAVIDEVKAKRNFLYGLRSKIFEIHEKITDISRELEKKYPDARQCYLFHVMIQSGIDREKCNRFDFPGNDSIVKFLEDLCQEYKTE